MSRIDVHKFVKLQFQRACANFGGKITFDAVLSWQSLHLQFPRYHSLCDSIFTIFVISSYFKYLYLKPVIVHALKLPVLESKSSRIDKYTASNVVIYCVQIVYGFKCLCLSLTVLFNQFYFLRCVLLSIY